MAAKVDPVFQQVYTGQTGVFVGRGVVLADLGEPLPISKDRDAIPNDRPFAALRRMDGMGFEPAIPQKVPYLKHLAGDCKDILRPIMDPLNMGETGLGNIFDLTLDFCPAVKIIVVVAVYR